MLSNFCLMSDSRLIIHMSWVKLVRMMIPKRPLGQERTVWDMQFRRKSLAKDQIVSLIRNWKTENKNCPITSLMFFKNMRMLKKTKAFSLQNDLHNLETKNSIFFWNNVKFLNKKFIWWSHGNWKTYQVNHHFWVRIRRVIRFHTINLDTKTRQVNIFRPDRDGYRPVCYRCL